MGSSAPKGIRRPKRKNPGAARCGEAGHAFVVIDRTLIAIDRVAKDRPFYSG